MRWTVRLEARTDTGEVETTELVTIGRPVVGGTLAELGLALSEAKSVLAKLQASMVQSQVADYAACHRVCPQCRVPQPLKDRRSRRLQTLFGTVEVEAPRFRVCRCRPLAPTAAVTLSPVCALLTARCTPELERVQAELGARTSFREAARILEALLPAPPANHESVRNRTHVAARQLEAADQRAAAPVVVGDTAAAGVIQPIVMLDGAYVRAVPGHQVRN
ncbi:MAG TPA: ISKra4 family transposase, partial [Reyranella sp.]|nr:ISKra4 family transposase [Reyranella sp.]